MHAKFSKDGTWDKILLAMQTEADAAGEIDWNVSVDSTVARVHQHGATAARSKLTTTAEFAEEVGVAQPVQGGVDT